MLIIGKKNIENEFDFIFIVDNLYGLECDVIVLIFGRMRKLFWYFFFYWDIGRLYVLWNVKLKDLFDINEVF